LEHEAVHISGRTRHPVFVSATSQLNPPTVRLHPHRVLAPRCPAPPNACRLTDEQVGKFKSLIAEHQKARIQGQANVNLAEVDVRALMRDDKADMAAIENAIRKSEAAQSAVRIETAKAIRTARTIFTPEQLQKWRATRATRHAEEQQPNQEAPKS